MSILSLLVVAAVTLGAVSGAPAPYPLAPEGAPTEQRDAMRAIWRECLFDRADALAGYGRVRPEKAAELAFAGCEEKARFFRELVSATAPEAERQAIIAAVNEEMRRYALVVARTSAAVPP